MTTALRRLQLRIERSCERRGAHYPWWIATFSTVTAIAIAVAAWQQRGGFEAPALIWVALALRLYSFLVWFPRAYLVPPWVEAITTMLAFGLFLTVTATPDLATFLLLMSAGEVAAVSRVWSAVLVEVACVGLVIVAGALGRLDNVGLYAIGVVLAGSVGVALRWQMRALRAEQDNALLAQERAITGERQRLAREVHDVVGHSLSINLLHVTAARHALAQHADIVDAIESLTEAERVGRSAMGDLRRTVAVLAAGPGETQPLPGVADIADLVRRSRDAGLDVTYSVSGDPTRLGDAVGLGLFRIVQESLGNVARHASRSAATVILAEDAAGARLEVGNALPPDSPFDSTGGTGLPGMAARAEQMGAQLRAGPAGARWVVELVIPAPLDRPALPRVRV